jgi:enediyne biosynthesis protein E4
MMRTLSLLLIATLCACGGDDNNGTPSPEPDAGVDAGDTDNPDTGDTDTPDVPDTDVPPEICAAEPYTAGATAFAEATDAWGLAELEVRGVRLNVANFDGDAWPDLVVRSGGNRSRIWLLRNTGAGKFEDVTESSGFLALRAGDELRPAGEAIAFGDVDNDGDLDGFAAVNTTDPELTVITTSEVMLNNGDGTFVHGPQNSDTRRPDAVPAGAVFVDYDRDGNLDLFVPQNVPAGQNTPAADRLYRGDGAGAFREVSATAGVVSEDWTLDALNGGRAHTVAWSGAACDLNNDGTPELLASSYGRSPNHLWRGSRSGSEVTFENVSVASGYAWDGRNDWSDNESARCHCKLHRDAPGCLGVPEPRLIRCNSDNDVFRWRHDSDREPFRLGGNSGATICADINNDGWIDLLTTEIVHFDVGSSSDPSELVINTGSDEVVFERPGNETTGLTRDRQLVAWNDGDITGGVFDFDNDGWQDVYIGSTDYPGARGLFYRQDAPLEFSEIALTAGIENNRSHGMAIADFDRDGDLDVILGHSRSRCAPGQEPDPTPCYESTQVRFFENTFGQDSQWVQLKLEGGSDTNRAAIGARATVTARGTQTVVQTQDVDGGHGHFGAQRDLTLHFGLADACQAEVTIRWPDAELTEQTFTVEAGARYVVTQGQDPERQ